MSAHRDSKHAAEDPAYVDTFAFDSEAAPEPAEDGFHVDEDTVEVPLTGYQSSHLLPPGALDAARRAARQVRLADVVVQSIVEVAPIVVVPELDSLLRSILDAAPPIAVPELSSAAQRALLEMPGIAPQLSPAAEQALTASFGSSPQVDAAMRATAKAVTGMVDPIDLVTPVVPLLHPGPPWTSFGPAAASFDPLAASVRIDMRSVMSALTPDVLAQLPTPTLDLNALVRNNAALRTVPLELSDAVRAQVADLFAEWTALSELGHLGARDGVRAAWQAREAVLRGDTAAVAEFAVTWLPFSKAHAWVIDAVSAALLEDGWLDLAPDQALRHLQASTTRHRRAQKCLWELDLGGHTVGLLDVPTSSDPEFTRADLLEGPHARIAGFEDPRVPALLDRLSETERMIALAYGQYRTWDEAARACGQPPRRGEAVRRKLKAAGHEYNRRRDARRRVLQGTETAK